MTVVRVAAVQAAPVFLDRDATVEKAVSLIAEGAAGGAELVAFPETWIPGYPAWIFGAAGWDDAAQKRAFGRLSANAVELPSPAVDVLCRAAKKAGVVVAVGMTERDARTSRGTLYNSILYVSERGQVLGAHRKLMPTHAERIVWGQGDGSTLHVFATQVGRVGGLPAGSTGCRSPASRCTQRESRFMSLRGRRSAIRSSIASAPATTPSRAAASPSASWVRASGRSTFRTASNSQMRWVRPTTS
jgi:hypothetical protein